MAGSHRGGVDACGLCLLPRLSPLLAPIRTARPLAGERAVRIAGHHQDGGPTLEQAGHHQRVTDHLGDANLLAVIPVELERAVRADYCAASSAARTRVTTSRGVAASSATKA